MPQVTIKVDAGEVKTAIRNAVLAVSSLPVKIIRPIMELARDEQRTYPPELPNQKYVRTGKRYSATKLENKGRNAYQLVSNPRYARGQTGNPYTIGDAQGEGQARIHQGRWPRMYDVMQRAIDRIVEKGREYFRDVLERNGAP